MLDSSRSRIDDGDPIEQLLAEVRAALAAGLYTVALMGALAAIDICAALESPDGRTTRSKFKSWFVDHFKERYWAFDADDAYELRCSMLHQGRVHASNYDSIIFSLPTSPFRMHNNVFNSTLNLDLEYFVDDILRTVRAWWTANRLLEPVVTNAQALTRTRPQGMAPFASGLPLYG